MNADATTDRNVPIIAFGLPVVNKVRIEDSTIYINGQKAGRIVGHTEVWVMGLRASAEPYSHGEFVARFKYGRAKRTAAKKFVKEVFSRLSMDQYLDKLKELPPGGFHQTPLGIAREIGANC